MIGFGQKMVKIGVRSANPGLKSLVYVIVTVHTVMEQITSSSMMMRKV